jgi:influenza virus NS1A-binding protein
VDASAIDVHSQIEQSFD